MPAVNASPVKAGSRFTRELFEKLWGYHNEWTSAFFVELDHRGDPGRFDRAKAPVIMKLLKRQLLSPRYIQHSARVLFVVGQANHDPPFSLPGTLSNRKSSISIPCLTSNQVTGVDTGALGFGRTEYNEASVRPQAF